MSHKVIPVRRMFGWNFVTISSKMFIIHKFKLTDNLVLSKEQLISINNLAVELIENKYSTTLCSAYVQALYQHLEIQEPSKNAIFSVKYSEISELFENQIFPYMCQYKPTGKHKHNLWWDIINGSEQRLEVLKKIKLDLIKLP